MLFQRGMALINIETTSIWAREQSMLSILYSIIIYWLFISFYFFEHGRGGVTSPLLKSDKYPGQNVHWKAQLCTKAKGKWNVSLKCSISVISSSIGKPTNFDKKRAMNSVPSIWFITYSLITYFCYWENKYASLWWDSSFINNFSSSNLTCSPSSDAFILIYEVILRANTGPFHSDFWVGQGRRR